MFWFLWVWREIKEITRNQRDQETKKPRNNSVQAINSKVSLNLDENILGKLPVIITSDDWVSKTLINWCSKAEAPSITLWLDCRLKNIGRRMYKLKMLFSVISIQFWISASKNVF